LWTGVGASVIDNTDQGAVTSSTLRPVLTGTKATPAVRVTSIIRDVRTTATPARSLLEGKTYTTDDETERNVTISRDQP